MKNYFNKTKSDSSTFNNGYSAQRKYECFLVFFFLTPAAPGFSPQYQSLLNLKKAITFYLRGNMSWEWGGNMLSIRIRGGTKELLEHYIPEEN